MVELRVSRSLMAVMGFVVSFGCGESSRSLVAPDGVTVTPSVGEPAVGSTPAGNEGGFQSAIPTTAPVLGTAAATRPLTDSRPFQAVCEAQGGRFSASFNVPALFCRKSGAFPGFTGNQLHVLSTVCEQVYGAGFAIFGSEPGDTETVTLCEVF